ncbi:chromophore lyase CpcT/CpeT [Aureisphaera galaxeae]|uniref:chromophore lyase CpcT/CpeT n=1 Tax=Aureisphaera galaxeae TaxID=1538023 RepID=UPI002350C590|nr:chromophore lyase CpcT/CpeT [Aureisphaera galaxeae]MDC8005527.1 chromophore lyase CpcT/CpeT [Aureisphaera galaxeae]
MKKIVLFLSFITVIACKNKESQHEETVAPEAHLEELYALMQGSFNSEKQSVADSSFYNISLHMYPIWSDKGHYLYVEQALNSMQDKPYRQRVYQLTQLNDSIYSSAVYTLPNDSLWIGKWKNPTAFDSISPTELITREGCAVLLKRLGENHYKGATDTDKCKSSLRGASYATSKVEITPTKIESWDQGFNAEGEQVWGAEKAGYVFDKLE